MSLFVFGGPVIEGDTAVGPYLVGPAVQFLAVDVGGFGWWPLESGFFGSHLVELSEGLEGGSASGVVLVALDCLSAVFSFSKGYSMGMSVYTHGPILVHQRHKTSFKRLNLDLPDYLGTYADGPILGEWGYQPASGLSSSVLTETAESSEFEALRVTEARVERDGGVVRVSAVPYVKPTAEGEYETNSRGYATLDPVPAMEFFDVSDAQAALIEAFVPYAVAEAGGFAGYRDNATKTNSPLDRLERLTLPALSDVEGGIERYAEARERAAELDEKIERTDELIDEIVYELYGLTDGEIRTVEEAVGE